MTAFLCPGIKMPAVVEATGQLINDQQRYTKMLPTDLEINAGIKLIEEKAQKRREVPVDSMAFTDNSAGCGVLKRLLRRFTAMFAANRNREHRRHGWRVESAN